MVCRRGCERRFEAPKCQKSCGSSCGDLMKLCGSCDSGCGSPKKALGAMGGLSNALENVSLGDILKLLTEGFTSTPKGPS